ncbi:unnamed protein product, partial [Choristocarpus tenellus]
MGSRFSISGANVTSRGGDQMQEGSSREDSQLSRQISNWGDEIMMDEANNQSEVIDAVSGVSGEVQPQVVALESQIVVLESQVVAVENALDPRNAEGDVVGAYGRQLYSSLAHELSDAQRKVKDLVDQLQTLNGNGRGTIPTSLRERLDGLLGRLERVDLAHSARCPPQELERRLSRSLLSARSLSTGLNHSSSQGGEERESGGRGTASEVGTVTGGRAGNRSGGTSVVSIKRARTLEDAVWESSRGG